MPRTMRTSGGGRSKRSATHDPPRTAAAIASSPMAISTTTSCRTGNTDVSTARGGGRRPGGADLGGLVEEGAHRRDDAVLVGVGQLGRAGQRQPPGEEPVADRSPEH